MKIARLLIYEGTADKLQTQLGGSLLDGRKKFGKITVSTITIGITEGLNRFVEAQFDPIEKAEFQRLKLDQERMKLATANIQKQMKMLRTEGYTVKWSYRLQPRGQEVLETYCSIFKDSSNDFIGICRKHPKETPNLKYARYLSFDRAYEQYERMMEVIDEAKKESTKGIIG